MDLTRVWRFLNTLICCNMYHSIDRFSSFFPMLSHPPRLLDPLQKTRLLHLSTWLAIGVGLLLVSLKLWAFLVTSSLSLLSSLLDSIMDTLASGVNLVAIRHALKPPTEQFRFGHGKAEALAGLGQAAFTAGSALFLMVHALERMTSPPPITHPAIGLWVMGISAAVTAVYVTFQRQIAKKVNSVAVSADLIHYVGDTLVNVGVMASLSLSYWLGWVWTDPIFSIGIGLYILTASWKILRHSLDILMDKELPEEERITIIDLVRSEPRVLGLHDLRTRTSGSTVFIQLHLELADNLNLNESHKIGDLVEQKIIEYFPGAEIIIHLDPYSIVQEDAPGRIKFSSPRAPLST